MICTFFGNRDAPSAVSGRLESILTGLIENDGADTFYVGNQGNFDFCVRRVLEKLKKIYPHIRCFTVLAYMPVQGNTVPYETIYPEGLEYVPRKFAILKRNEWLAKHSDIVITYVKYSFGGALRAKEYAEKLKRRIIEL